MLDNPYPRMATIVVPDNIRREHIGEFVSHRARQILDDLGASRVTGKSVGLETVSERLYILRYQSNAVFTLPKDLVDEGLDTRKSPVVEASVTPAPEDGPSYGAGEIDSNPMFPRSYKRSK